MAIIQGFSMVSDRPMGLPMFHIPMVTMAISKQDEPSKVDRESRLSKTG